MGERRRGRGEEGPSRRHGPQRRAGWLVPASSRHPPPPPTLRPPRGGWRRESTVKSPSAALVEMGTGSSSYRPKAIYLDIDGRIQKVAPSPSFPARRGRPPGAPPVVPARRRPLPGDSAGSRRRVGAGQGAPAGEGTAVERTGIRGACCGPRQLGPGVGGALRGRCPHARPRGKARLQGGIFSISWAELSL